MGVLNSAHATALRLARLSRFWPLLLVALLPLPAFAVDYGTWSPDILLSIAALCFASAMTIWALTEHRTSAALRKAVRTSADKARGIIAAREAWLSAGREALKVWNPGDTEPISFGSAKTPFQQCMAGQDSP